MENFHGEIGFVDHEKYGRMLIQLDSTKQNVDLSNLKWWFHEQKDRFDQQETGIW